MPPTERAIQVEDPATDITYSVRRLDGDQLAVAVTHPNSKRRDVWTGPASGGVPENGAAGIPPGVARELNKLLAKAQP